MNIVNVLSEKCCVIGCERKADYAIGEEIRAGVFPAIKGLVYCFEHATIVGAHIKPEYGLAVKPLRRFWESAICRQGGRG
jgi:hypothetical protein